MSAIGDPPTVPIPLPPAARRTRGREWVSIGVTVAVLVSTAIITLAVWARPTFPAVGGDIWLPGSGTTWLGLTANGASVGVATLSTAREPLGPDDVDLVGGDASTFVEALAHLDDSGGSILAPGLQLAGPFAPARTLAVSDRGLELVDQLYNGTQVHFKPRPVVLPARATVGQRWSDTFSVFAGPVGTEEVDGSARALAALTIESTVQAVTADGCATVARTFVTSGQSLGSASDTWCPGRGRVAWSVHGIDTADTVFSVTPVADTAVRSRLDATSPAAYAPAALPVGAQRLTFARDHPVAGTDDIVSTTVADPALPPVVAGNTVIDAGRRMAGLTGVGRRADVSDGLPAVLWRLPLPTAPLASALVGGTAFYAAGSEVVAVDAGSGLVRWRRSLSSPVMSLVAAGSTVLAIGWSGRIGTLDRSTGTTVASTTRSGPLLGAVATADGAAVVDAAAKLTRLDDRGASRSVVDLRHQASGSLSAADGAVAVGTADGHVVLVRGAAIVRDVLSPTTLGGVAVAASGATILGWDDDSAVSGRRAFLIAADGRVTTLPMSPDSVTAIENGWVAALTDGQLVGVRPTARIGTLGDKVHLCRAARVTVSGHDVWVSDRCGLWVIPGVVP